MKRRQRRKRLRNNIAMLRIDRVHNFAAGHPIQVGGADRFAIAWHFDIERRNSVHWNHDRIRTWQTDAGTKLARSQDLRAQFIPGYYFRPCVRFVVEEDPEEHDLIISARRRDADAKDRAWRAIGSGRGSYVDCLDPAGCALWTRSRTRVLPQIDPSVFG